MCFANGFTNKSNLSSLLDVYVEANQRGMTNNVLEICLGSVGIVFNSLCLLVWLQPEMYRKHGSIFWITLAAYDLVSLLVTLVMSVAMDVSDVHTERYFVLGNVLFMTKNCATYTNMALSFDRALAVAAPLKWKILSSTYTNRSVAVGLFILGFIDRIPFILKWISPSIKHFHDGVKVPVIDTLFNLAIPVIIIAIANGVVVVKLIKRRRVNRRTSWFPSRRYDNREVYKITAQLFLVTFTTIITNGLIIPMCLLLIPKVCIGDFIGQVTIVTITRIFSFIRLSHIVNSSVNFIIYILFCKSFRLKCTYLTCSAVGQINKF